MHAGRFLVLCAVFGATVASAQSYVVTSASAPFAKLTAPTVPALLGSSPSDNGYAVIPIGFEFPYFGATYEQLTVTADGLAYFEPNPGSSSFPTNTSLPSGAPPHGVIAPFWDNLEGSNPASRLGYQSGTGPNGKSLTIEWFDWNHWSGTATYDLRFQLRLHENGLIEIHHGSFTGAGQALTGTVGIEDPTGTLGVTAKSCSPNCAASNIAANELLSFGPGPNTTDLLAGKLVVDSVIESGGVLTIDTSFDVRNFGTVAASNVEYALYLSPDTKLDPTDTALSPAAQGSFSVPGLGKVTHSATSTVPKPSVGAWFILAAIDPANVVAETSESNNVGHLTAPLMAGSDLVAQDISSATTSSGPGSPVTNTLTFANPGIDGAGTVQWSVLLSSNTVVDSGDIVVQQGYTTVAGGQSITLPITYNLPGGVPEGSYHFLLQLDPNNLVTELSEANNVVASANTFLVKQADLSASSLEMREPLPPYDVASQSYFGEPFRAEVPLSNLGGAAAQSVSVDLYLSSNDTLSLLSDALMATAGVPSVAPFSSTTVVVTGLVPTTDKGGVQLLPGQFHLFAVVSSSGVDPNPANNVVRLGPYLLVNPGPDLEPLSVSTQAALAGGEVVPVTRLLRNAGNQAAPATPYRYCLTKNGVVTAQDPAVPIFEADGSLSSEGTVTLAANQSDARTEWVRIPDGLPPGDYFIGVLMDPTGVLAETDELNNGVAGTPVTVAPAALQLLTNNVPDALAGVPFVYRVTAVGGTAPLQYAQVGGDALPGTLSLDPGTGLITGVANATGVFPFTVRATDAIGRSAQATLVIRVIESSAAVTITSTRLPLPVLGVPYSAALSAQGGAQPYRWGVVGGALPAGLTLAQDGTLSGVPEGPVGSPSELEVQVIDALGTSDRERFSLEVLAPDSIYIETRAFPEAQLGVEFATELIARSANNEPLPPPVSWAVVAGHTPAGLYFESGGPALWILRGVPAEAGAFPVSIEVQDGQGRAYTGELILTVHRSVARLVSTVPRFVLPGSEVSGAFSFEDGRAGTFQVQSGRLPPGVTLAQDGTVSGRIPDEAPLGTWTFTVSARNEAGAESLTSFAIDVTDELPEAAGGCGCAASGTGSAGWLALGILAMASAAARGRRLRGPLCRPSRPR